MNPMPGRGFGMGFGGGRGFGGGGGGRGRRNMFYATGLPGWMRFNQGFVAPQVEPSAEAQKNFLKEQAVAIQAQLDQVKARLAALSSTETEAK
jgi:hypothetical protein